MRVDLFLIRNDPLEWVLQLYHSCGSVGGPIAIGCLVLVLALVGCLTYRTMQPLYEGHAFVRGVFIAIPILLCIGMIAILALLDLP